MLFNVLKRLAADTGYGIVQQRAALLALLNQSALELYNMLECNKIYREATLVVAKNSVVALPNFVGELRGMRAHTEDAPFDLNSIGSPRYVSGVWNYRVRNWRDLGETPVHTLVSLVGPLTLTIDVIDATVSVLIVGQTNIAQRIQETIVMDAASKTTVNSFGPAIYKIASFSPRNGDITILDGGAIEVAKLYNTDNQSRYKLVDVSEVFWSDDTSNSESLIDVAYKVPLIQFSQDADSFPAGDDYDNAWYNMAMSLYYLPLENGAAQATAYRGASLAAVIAAKDGSEDQIVKKLSFGRNKFFSLFNRSNRRSASSTQSPMPQENSPSNWSF